MDHDAAQTREFELSGGSLCLDFVNTLDDRPDLHPREFLASYGDVLLFARVTASLPDAQLAALEVAAEGLPDAAYGALEHMRELREVLYRLFLALAEGRTVPSETLASLNEALAEALAHARIVTANQPDTSPRTKGADSINVERADIPGVTQTFAWAWATDPLLLSAPIWPVLRSAADLLASPDLKGLRVCASDSCSWLFLDTSRNGSRRWCSMRTCGNRAKARRHHARTRTLASASPADAPRTERS